MVKQIREKDIEIENLQKTIEVLETKITKFIESNAIEKDKEDTQTNNLYIDKIGSMARQIYILEKRRLRFDFCDKEFMQGSEKDRKEKATHIREMHTFECNVCELRHKIKEELEIYLLTFEMYVCSLCSYKHKRLSEKKNHCKTKHTQNTIIKH